MPIKIKSSTVEPILPPPTGEVITIPPARQVGVDPAGQAIKESGEKLKQFGDLAIRVAADLKERDDKTLAGNAYLDFSNRTRDIENKYFSRKGINAQGMFDEYRQDMDREFNNVNSGIESRRAQEMFESISRSRRISSALSVQTRERTELDKAHLETSNAMIEDSTQDAIENYNNPVAILDARNKIIIGVGQSADMLGWSADREKLALDNALSKMHVGVVQNMLIDNAASAKDYMEANIEEIQGTDRIDLEPKIERYGVLQESQALADQVHAEAKDKNLSLTDELELIPKGDADVRKATEGLIRQKLKDEDIAEIQARDNAKSFFFEVLNASLTTVTDKINAANIIEHQGDRNNALLMIGTQQRQVLSDTNQKIEKQSPIHTFNAKDAIDNGLITNRNQLIDGYFNKVNKSDFNFLIGYLNQGGRVGNLKPSSYNTPFKNLIGDIDDNKNLYLSTVKYITDQVESGIDPTPERINQWVINAATPGEEIEGLWFDNLTYAQAIDEGVDKQWLPKILDSEDAEIIDAIKLWNKNNATKPQKEITEFNKRLWKRTNIMKLRPPDPSIKDLF